MLCWRLRGSFKLRWSISLSRSAAAGLNRRCLTWRRRRRTSRLIKQGAWFPRPVSETLVRPLLWGGLFAEGRRRRGAVFPGRLDEIFGGVFSCKKRTLSSANERFRYRPEECAASLRKRLD